MNKLYILSGPSGVGKTAIGTLLLENPDLNLVRLITTTTRNPRIGETEGVDYFFISKEKFENDIKQTNFAEWAEVFGNYYGTSKVLIKKHWTNGNDILLIIDWKGHQILKDIFKDEIVSIFLLPPSLIHLRQRLVDRNQDNLSSIEKRMAQAPMDITHQNEYNYVVVNDDIQAAKKIIEDIILEQSRNF